MPTDAIPPDLLAAQRAYDAAEVVLRDAVAAGADNAALDGLRTVVRAAVVALYRARTEAGPDWAAYSGQRKVQDAARA